MKVLIVGCGRIGRVHAEAVRQQPGVVLRVADRDREAARRLADVLEIPALDGEPEIALTRERPDVVHVCTPPSSHADLTVRALRAGARVLSEKPMALDAAEVALVAAALRTRPGALCVDHNFLFEPEVLRARRWVAEGRIGRVVSTDVFYGVDAAVGAAGGPGAWASTLPGGRFTDLLPHGLYLLRHFLGDFEELSARAGAHAAGGHAQ